MRCPPAGSLPTLLAALQDLICLFQSHSSLSYHQILNLGHYLQGGKGRLKRAKIQLANDV